MRNWQDHFLKNIPYFFKMLQSKHIITAPLFTSSIVNNIFLPNIIFLFTPRSSFLHIRIVCSKCRKYIVSRCGHMIWLILFLPAVMIWAFVLFIHVKSGKSNHHYHEPLIFYSQRISPFRVEHSKNNYKDETEKSYRK